MFCRRGRCNTTLCQVNGLADCECREFFTECAICCLEQLPDGECQSAERLLASKSLAESSALMKHDYSSCRNGAGLCMDGRCQSLSGGDVDAARANVSASHSECAECSATTDCAEMTLRDIAVVVVVSLAGQSLLVLVTVVIWLRYVTLQRSHNRSSTAYLRYVRHLEESLPLLTAKDIARFRRRQSTADEIGAHAQSSTPRHSTTPTRSAQYRYNNMRQQDKRRISGDEELPLISEEPVTDNELDESPILLHDFPEEATSSQVEMVEVPLDVGSSTSAIRRSTGRVGGKSLGDSSLSMTPNDSREFGSVVAHQVIRHERFIDL